MKALRYIFYSSNSYQVVLATTKLLFDLQENLWHTCNQRCRSNLAPTPLKLSAHNNGNLIFCYLEEISLVIIFFTGTHYPDEPNIMIFVRTTGDITNTCEGLM